MLGRSPARSAALLAVVLLAMGAVGPWATGVWRVDPLFEEPRFAPRSEHGGFVLLAPALLVATALLLMRDARVRAWSAAAGFALSGAVCLVAWTDGEYGLGLRIDVFAGWESVGPGWGLILATLASALGLLASLATLPRGDAWKGAHF